MLKRKRKKTFTIHFVRDDAKESKSFWFPPILVYTLAIFGIVSIVTVTYLSFSFLHYQVTKENNIKLAQINNTQKEKLDSYTQRLDKVNEDLNKGLEIKQNIESLVSNSRVKLTPTPSRSSGTEAISLMSRKTNGQSSVASVSEDDNKVKLFSNSSGLEALDEVDIVLTQLEEQMSEQQENLEVLEEETKSKLKFLAATPSQWPIKGRITSYFGYRSNPFTNRGKEFHGGLDIAEAYGSVIKAAGDGTVTFAGWNGAFGKTVILNHGYGYTSMYGHNSAILVKVGQKVKRGDVLARLGNTGRSTGPHVHFQIEKYSNPTDPMKMLVN